MTEYVRRLGAVPTALTVGPTSAGILLILQPSVSIALLGGVIVGVAAYWYVMRMTAHVD